MYGSPGTGKTIILMQELRRKISKYRLKKKNVQVLFVIFHPLIRKNSQIFIDMKEKYVPSLLMNVDYKLMDFKEACRGLEISIGFQSFGVSISVLCFQIMVLILLMTKDHLICLLLF